MRVVSSAVGIFLAMGMAAAANATTERFMALVSADSVEWHSEDGEQFGCADGESLVINSFKGATNAHQQLSLTLARCRKNEETAAETAAMWSAVQRDLTQSDRHAILDVTLRRSLAEIISADHLVPAMVSED